MRAGRLRHRITIQYHGTISRDAAGQEVITWVDLATVWANVQASQGAREVFVSRADQEQATSTHVVRMRYRGDVDVKMRILWNNLVLDIENVLDADGRTRETICICRAVI